MPLEEALTLFKQPLEKDKKQRMLLLRQEDLAKDPDVNWHAQNRAECKVLSLENYNFLHLASALEFARSILSQDNDAIRDFYSLLMHQALSAGELERLTQRQVISLILPSIATGLIEDINTIRKEYAQFISSA